MLIKLLAVVVFAVLLAAVFSLFTWLAYRWELKHLKATMAREDAENRRIEAVDWSPIPADKQKYVN